MLSPEPRIDNRPRSPGRVLKGKEWKGNVTQDQASGDARKQPVSARSGRNWMFRTTLAVSGLPVPVMFMILAFMLPAFRTIFQQT